MYYIFIYNTFLYTILYIITLLDFKQPNKRLQIIKKWSFKNVFF